MKAFVAVILLGGCSYGACHPVVEHVSVVERVPVVVSAPVPRAPDALIAEYKALNKAEKPWIMHTGAGHIDHLIKLDSLVRVAMKPVVSSTHIATQAEIGRAIVAMGELRAYLRAPQ